MVRSALSRSLFPNGGGGMAPAEPQGEIGRQEFTPDYPCEMWCAWQVPSTVVYVCGGQSASEHQMFLWCNCSNHLDPSRTL